MSPRFEELDYRPTPIGALTLRRRWEPRLATNVFEIKLGDAFLMSSHVTASEIALARLGLAAAEGAALDVVIGGLGLGYTAAAALDEPRVARLTVIELLGPVIEWHESGLAPLGPRLTGDPRCRLEEADFFACAARAEGFGRPLDAILVDIDHSPDALLDARSGAFYRTAGLAALARCLKPGGVFGLWSDAHEDPAFTARLGAAFAEARAEPVTFQNPMQDAPFTQTVYLARTARG